VNVGRLKMTVKKGDSRRRIYGCCLKNRLASVNSHWLILYSKGVTKDAVCRRVSLKSLVVPSVLGRRDPVSLLPEFTTSVVNAFLATKVNCSVLIAESTVTQFLNFSDFVEESRAPKTKASRGV